MTTAASRNKRLNLIMISRFQGSDTFVPFQPMRFISFLEKRGTHFFTKMSTDSLFFSVPSPYPVKSSVLRARPVLLRFYPRLQRSYTERHEQSSNRMAKKIYFELK